MANKNEIYCSQTDSNMYIIYIYDCFFQRSNLIMLTTCWEQKKIQIRKYRFVSIELPCRRHNGFIDSQSNVDCRITAIFHRSNALLYDIGQFVWREVTIETTSSLKISFIVRTILYFVLNITRLAPIFNMRNLCCSISVYFTVISVAVFRLHPFSLSNTINPCCIRPHLYI